MEPQTQEIRLPPGGGMLNPFWSLTSEVATFWQNKAWGWWNSRTEIDSLLEDLASAPTFEHYTTAALRLDGLLGADVWRQSMPSKQYDFKLIYSRVAAIFDAREEEDVNALISLLRAGLVRNLGNITAESLYSRAYGGTKLIIEDYVTQVALGIEFLQHLPAHAAYESGWTAQMKLDLFHDMRQAFGRSTLILQGGAIFGLCHLGVVKALHLRGLLPRIITGTATGALIAALVGIHTDEELLQFLNGEGIDLTAFVKRKDVTRSSSVSSTDTSVHHDDARYQELKDASGGDDTLFETLKRRTKRYLREGYFLDVNVIESCLRANVGNLTFEEAYNRTKRVLNITVATTGRSGLPNLLNYITAPNVLIWSAALASNASSATLYHPVILKCKDENGNIVPWVDAQQVSFASSWRGFKSSSANNGGFLSGGGTYYSSNERDNPLARIAELFNVNHFIVSQARPYVAPFLRSEFQHPHPSQSPLGKLAAPLLRLVTGEVHHRLTQLDQLGWLYAPARRLLLDETIPGAHITILPSLTASDFLRLLDTPTKESLEYWIAKGERSVWPVVGALRIRCVIEVELDRAYQLVRRRRAGSVSSTGGTNANAAMETEAGLDEPPIEQEENGKARLELHRRYTVQDS